MINDVTVWRYLKRISMKCPTSRQLGFAVGLLSSNSQGENQTKRAPHGYSEWKQRFDVERLRGDTYTHMRALNALGRRPDYNEVVGGEETESSNTAGSGL